MKTSPVVVLTGASSGIGHAAAIAFANDGARLVLAARGREGLESVAAECRKAGADVLVVPTDVTDARAVSRLAEAAVAGFGGIDVWINNVGVGAVGRFDKTPLEAHRRVIETNLLGHLHGAYAAVPYFRRRGEGVLINMVSLGGFVPAPYAAAYSASKFGIRGLSEALRAELSDMPGIYVCEVYPTFVDTPGMSHGANYTGRRVRPPPPLVDPRRVAAVLVALAHSPRASVQIGSPAMPGRLAHAIAPNLVGRIMNALMGKALSNADAALESDGNLYAPSRNTAIDGGFSKPLPKALALGGAAAIATLAVALWWHRSRSPAPTAARRLRRSWRSLQQRLS